MNKRLLGSLALSVCVASSLPAFGYERDTHYYLTFYLALQTTCFKGWESWVLASADWSQDHNPTTASEISIVEIVRNVLGQRPHVPNQRRWHAFMESGSEEERSKRQEELWARVEREDEKAKQLVYLGQLLHFVQDSFAHRGYEPGLGHGLDTLLGNDPDMLREKEREMDMVRATLDVLLRTCDLLKRSHASKEELEKRVEPLMDMLIRPGRFSRRTEDLRAVRRNAHRINQAIEQSARNVASHCWATAGLIPDPLRVRYDKSGEPISLTAITVQVDASRCLG